MSLTTLIFFGSILFGLTGAQYSALPESFLVFGARVFHDTFAECCDTLLVEEEYDFIIVGAGSAGAALAARLSENKNVTVLLIEAGRSEEPWMNIPELCHLLQQWDINWNYKTDPSVIACLAMINQQCKWPRGKVMGGSSVLNYMAYTHGNRQDYDNWESYGNPGWNFSSVLPYLKKEETTNLKNVPVDPAYRGESGPVNVIDSFYLSPSVQAFINGSVEYGFKDLDYNGEYQISASQLQTNQKNGQRQSSNVAYLYPICGSRSNLQVMKYSLVTKILLDDNNNAYGVVYSKSDLPVSVVVKARREVIISAGAINSPQLLMLSGIGPADQLAEFNIDVKADLPGVGKNLQDHIGPQITLYSEAQTLDFLNILIANQSSSFPEYFLDNAGPITGPGGAEGILFTNTLDPLNLTAYPDIEFFIIGGSLNSFPTFQDNFNIKQDVFNQQFAVLDPLHNFMIFVLLQHPQSRGEILLQSSNPYVYPKIVPNYLSVPADYEPLVRGIRLIQNITKMPSLQALGVKVNNPPLPACTNLYKFDTDNYWKCYTSHLTFNVYHYCGTCKMGPSNDPLAVVDERLRVYKVQNLRVVDASIMPTIISGHLNCPTMMIAEIAADMIKQDNGLI